MSKNSEDICKDYYSMPDDRGHFGVYGGKFVAETLMEPIEELRLAYEKVKADKDFQAQFDKDLADYVGAQVLYIMLNAGQMSWVVRRYI